MLKIYELKIKGMTCQHCVMHVTKALKSIEGINVEDVQIGSAKILCDENKLDEIILQKKIEEAGYQLIGVQ